MLHKLITFVKTFLSKPSSKAASESTERVVPDEKLLVRLKDRFNYASSSCSARVLSCNPEASAPSALLSPSKDSYLRFSCSLKSKFVVVELCEAVKIDTVVLANYELFASTVKGFKVYAAGDKLNDPTVTQVIWKLILSAEMSYRLISKDQAFPVPSYPSFFKYLRIEFDDEFYGKERLCPISILKVYGKTMLDEFKEEIQLTGKSKEIVPVSSISEKDTILLKEMTRLTEKLTELQFNNNFLIRNRSFLLECPESEQQIQTLKDKYANLELQQSISLQQSDATGNVFKHFHDRINKLENSLKEHPINLILFRSRRHDTETETGESQIPRLNPTEFDDLFSSFNNLQRDFQQLSSIVASQQTKLTLLIILNSFLIVLILIRALRGFFSRVSSNVSDESSLKRRPLLELKNSPTSRNSSLSSSSSTNNDASAISNLSNNSLNGNQRCKSTPNIALSGSQKKKQQFTPGVVLSDDEVLHLLEEE